MTQPPEVVRITTSTLSILPYSTSLPRVERSGKTGGFITPCIALSTCTHLSDTSFVLEFTCAFYKGNTCNPSQIVLRFNLVDGDTDTNCLQ